MQDRPAGIPPEAELASAAGFNKHVGPIFRLPDGEDGALKRFVFAVAGKHMNGAGTVHGGMLMGFADTAMGRTSRLVSGAKSCSTVSLNCDFVGPGKLGDTVEARVRVTRQTRTLVFVSAELVSDGRMLLVATGLWRITGEA